MAEIRKIIGELPLFRGLEEDHLTHIVAIAQKRSFDKGELVFSEGDACSGFYIVEKGKVKIFKLSFGGKEQILHIYGPGKPFGEVPVFTGRNFPASAETVARSSLIFLPREAFVRLISENPALALNMLGVLSMRLREFTVLVENLALKEVPARLASYLAVLKKDQQSEAEVTLPVSKTQLAGLLGTTPETLSRIFARMSGQGLIEVNNREIRLIDPAGIEELSEGMLVV